MWIGSAQVPYPDPAFAQVVDQVQGVAHIPAEPVEGVDDDDVAVAGVLEQCGQPGAVGGGPGLAIDVNPVRRDTGRGEGVELPIEVLFRRRDTRVSQLHAAERIESCGRSIFSTYGFGMNSCGGVIDGNGS